ncbi:MAG: SPFH/Band 7/PHB domain protein, partial [Terracoccus sp.]
DSMEKQMRAERDRRAAILTAEGFKQSAILTAEGEKQSSILRAEGSAQARILEAQGQARAISQVFTAIHRGKPTQKLLAYQYLQVLPQIARGDSNKMWIVPSELTDALKGIGNAFGGRDEDPARDDELDWVDTGEGDADAFGDTVLADPAKALAEAREEAAKLSAESTEHTSSPARQKAPMSPSAPVSPAALPQSTAPSAPLPSSPAVSEPPMPPAPQIADLPATGPSTGEQTPPR